MPKATASSIAATFMKSEKVRTEQRCVSVGDALWLTCDAVGGAEGVAAPARSASRVRRTSRLAPSLMESARLSTSTADSASLRAIASAVVR
eukprot:3823847-Pleurochrysis_carterae.AAC.2